MKAATRIFEQIRRWEGASATLHFGITAMLTVVAALLTSLAFAPHEAWWLAWVSLLPVLLALRRVRHPLTGAVIGLLFGMTYLAQTLPWMMRLFSEATGWYLLTIGSLPFALFGGMAVLMLRLPPAWHLLALPLAWVATDYLRCEAWFFPFSWAQLGHTQVAWPAGLALFPLVGVYGVTLLIVLTNTVIVALYIANTRRLALGALTGVALLIIVALPLHRRVPLRGAAPSAQALLVQDERGGLSRQLALTRNARSLHPDLVVWHESVVGALPDGSRQRRRIAECARDIACLLVVGCAEHNGERHYNAAWIFASTGEVIGRYHKRHPVPGMEGGMTPGTLSPSFPTPVGRLGIAICYDFDYASIARELVHAGAEVLVVPTFEAASWSDLQHVQHARMAQARAAETGRWILRPTSSGISQIISPRGTVTASIPNGASATVAAPVFPLTERTPYIRAGYLLPFICLALAGILLLYCLLVPKPLASSSSARVSAPSAPSQ
jgi:apolipoprotein N-acyltransferase